MVSLTVGISAAGHPAWAETKPTSGGTLTIGTSGDLVFGSFDPAASTSPGSAAVGGLLNYAIFDFLMYDDTQTGQVEMGTAQSFTSQDGLVWTLKLNPGIKFSDGTPYDAEAVKYNFDRILDPTTQARTAAFFANIASMTVVDPLALRFSLKEANGQFARDIAIRNPMMVSPTAMRRLGPTEFGKAPVGAGPYVLESRIASSSTTLVRNSNYWRKGRPYIDKVIVKVLPDQQIRYQTLVTGGLDLMVADSDPTIGVTAKQAGFEVVEAPSFQPRQSYFRLNMNKAPFSDPRAREAFALAIDPKKIRQAYYGGQGALLDSMFPPQSPFYDPSAKRLRANAKAAQKLFDAVAADTGKPVEFTYATADAKEADVLTALLAPFQNVKVNAQVVASSVAATMLRDTRGVDVLGGGGWSGNDPEPGIQSLVGTTQGWYNNPQVTSALAAAKAAVDLKTRKAAYRTVQDIVLKDMPVVFWGVEAPPLRAIYKKGALGGVENRSLVTIFNLDQVWLKKQR